MDDAKPIPEFPDYLITPDGAVFTTRNGMPRRSSRTQNGAYKVTLSREGKAYTRSLPLLVAQTFVYNEHDPDIFDTPIHLNNDPADNRAENLAWRPRWFAVKYQRQYWNEEYRFSVVPVIDDKTGDRYAKIMDVCQRYGLLYIDVLNSCNRGVTVFPTWKTFSFA